jgi:hypothetical protein
MTLKGKDAEEFADAVARRNLELQKQQLEKAIADANAKGKEPFDLDRLEQLCDTSREGRVDPVDDRRARFEYKYYVENPEIMTIAEFAGLVAELNRW